MAVKRELGVAAGAESVGVDVQGAGSGCLLGRTFVLSELSGLESL